MQTVDFERYPQKDDLIKQIDACDWDAAKFLAELLHSGTFATTLGGWAKLFVTLYCGKLVSFVTLSCQDCVDDKTLSPWLGFLFTAEEYRGSGCARRILDYACAEAKRIGYGKVYLATDHVGLYEKLGFVYCESCIDVYGETSRIYTKELR